MSNKILVRNNTPADVLFVGAQLRQGETQEYTSYALGTLLTDLRFTNGVAAGDYVVNDGTKDLSPSQANVYLSSLTSGTDVIGVKSSLGYVTTNVVTATISDNFTVNPLQATSWILTVTGDTVLQISGISANTAALLSSSSQSIISTNVTIKQDDVGFHKITFEVGGNLQVQWADARSVQVPSNPNAVTTLNLTSVDGGVSWLVKETFRNNAVTGEVNTMFDSDNTRRPITAELSPIGVSLSSSRYIASGKLSYRMLANSSAATTAEVDITVDGIVRYTSQTPTFYQDQLVTQDVEIDETWQIMPGSVIELKFKENSGALTIEVKGDIQESTMSITNIVEGQPAPVVGVTSTEDAQMGSTLTPFGLTWVNDTGAGFLSATAALALTATSDNAVPLNLAITVDGVQRYSTSTEPLLSTQRLDFSIPIDESWQVYEDSMIEVYGSINDGATVAWIMGSTARSELIFADIVAGVPDPGEGIIEGINNNEIILSPNTLTPIVIVTSSTEISVGEMQYSMLLTSNYASSCAVSVTVDGVQRYLKEWTGVYSSKEYTDTVPVDVDWGITPGSEIILTCRETSSNNIIVMIVEGNISATRLTITSTV